jgi:hypothetical protein
VTRPIAPSLLLRVPPPSIRLGGVSLDWAIARLVGWPIPGTPQRVTLTESGFSPVARKLVAISVSRALRRRAIMTNTEQYRGASHKREQDDPNLEHRKLIPEWVKEEEQRQKLEETPPPLAVDADTAGEMQKLLLDAMNHGQAAQRFEEAQKKVRDLLTQGIEKIAAAREKAKLPTQYEREQKIMAIRRVLPPQIHLVSPNAIERRPDIFEPKIKGKAEAKSGNNNEEGNPDVNRIENWSIWAYVLASSGGFASWSDPYWRYRIWVPAFDTTVQPDRRLVVSPMAVLAGSYDLFALSFMFFSCRAAVTLRFWTGTWHWRFTGSTYSPEWSGWRRSFDVVGRESISINTHVNLNVPYPGTQVSTPSHFDPPGVVTQPNPINNYGLVKPDDIVDFYVRPELIADTGGPFSYARLGFDLIDVPFVTVDYQTGYLL